MISVRPFTNQRRHSETQYLNIAYCLLTPLLLWLCNSVPKQVLAFLHIVNLPLFGLMSADLLAAQFLSVSNVRGLFRKASRPRAA